jgi:hypothetical protein
VVSSLRVVFVYMCFVTAGWGRSASHAAYTVDAMANRGVHKSTVQWSCLLTACSSLI